MSFRLLDFHDLDINNIETRTPIERKDGDTVVSKFIEFIYDKHRILIKTPKLKVAFDSKPYKNIINVSASFDNMDFDLEINAFYKFIKQIDSHVLREYKKNKTWRVGGDKITFVKSIRKSKPSFPPFLSSRLLGQEDETKTVIYNHKGMQVSYDKIQRDCFVNQFLEMRGVYITAEKMYINFYSHQVLVHPKQELYLDKCILDEFDIKAPQTAVVRPVITTESRHASELSSAKSSTLPKGPAIPRMVLDANTLLGAKKKLKKTD